MSQKLHQSNILLILVTEVLRSILRVRVIVKHYISGKNYYLNCNGLSRILLYIPILSTPDSSKIRLLHQQHGFVWKLMVCYSTERSLYLLDCVVSYLVNMHYHCMDEWQCTFAILLTQRLKWIEHKVLPSTQ